VLPEYVLQVIVQVPDVALGIAFARSYGTVQDFDVPSPLPIVPLTDPIEYVRVCVNALDALGIFMVIEFPILTLEAERVGVVALGVVRRSMLNDPEGFT
jgi:hypothetical protein